MALPFALKIMLRQIKNYGNSNISPSMQKYDLKKNNPLKGTKILQDIKTLELISSFKHKPKYYYFFKNAHIKIDLLLLTRGL
jgi:hypothetical protein